MPNNRLISNIVKRTLHNRKDSDMVASHNGVEVDLIQFSTPLEKVHSLIIDSKDILSFQSALSLDFYPKKYIKENTFDSMAKKHMGKDLIEKNVHTIMKEACRGDPPLQNQISLHKVIAFSDLYKHYHLVRRGQKMDSEELYKILSQKNN